MRAGGATHAEDLPACPERVSPRESALLRRGLGAENNSVEPRVFFSVLVWPAAKAAVILDRNHCGSAGRRRRFRLCRSRRLVDAHGPRRLCSVARSRVSGRHGPRAAAACSAARLRVSGRHGSRAAAACSGIRLRVSGRRGSPSPPGGGRGLVSRSLLRRRSPASAPGDARTLRRGLGPQFPDEASLWLVPSTPVARVFLWIGATEGRPELTGLVITASLSGIAGGPARARPGKPPVCACLVLVGEW